jgi:hypothetical protein
MHASIPPVENKTKQKISRASGLHLEAELLAMAYPGRRTWWSTSMTSIGRPRWSSCRRQPPSRRRTRASVAVASLFLLRAELLAVKDGEHGAIPPLVVDTNSQAWWWWPPFASRGGGSGRAWRRPCRFWCNDAYPFGPSAACYIVGKSPLRGGTRLVRIRLEYYSVHIFILILHVLTSPLNLKLGRDLDYV